MAYKQQRTRYEASDTAKASMILYLEQFPEHMETITQIKESLRVPGGFCLDTYEAVILAGLVREYWPFMADKLMAPLKPCRQYEAGEAAHRHHVIVRRLAGDSRQPQDGRAGDFLTEQAVNDAIGLEEQPQ